MTLYEYIVFRMTVFFNFIDKEKVKVLYIWERCHQKKTISILKDHLIKQKRPQPMITKSSRNNAYSNNTETFFGQTKQKLYIQMFVEYAEHLGMNWTTMNDMFKTTYEQHKSNQKTCNHNAQNNIRHVLSLLLMVVSRRLHIYLSTRLNGMTCRTGQCFEADKWLGCT